MSFFLPNLKKHGYLNNVHMTVCSVGSRKINAEDDYASQGWEIFAPNLSIYGFDADADACDAANADIVSRQINWKEVHFPVGLGKAKEERTLYVTKHPMCSSLFQPNEAYIEKFLDLPELMSLDFSFEIDTTTLDEFCQEEGIDEIDFLQMDVQGAEIDVLEGTQNICKNVLGIQTEITFSPLYINQPLFADIDSYLRKQHFTLFCLGGWSLARKSPVKSSTRKGQLLWGDATYLRDFTSANMKTCLLTPDRIFKLACIADVIDFPDYCFELLNYLTLNFGSNPAYNFADIIIISLAELPDLVSLGLGNLEIIKDIRGYVSASLVAQYSL